MSTLTLLMAVQPEGTTVDGGPLSPATSHRMPMSPGSTVGQVIVDAAEVVELTNDRLVGAFEASSSSIQMTLTPDIRSCRP